MAHSRDQAAPAAPAAQARSATSDAAKAKALFFAAALLSLFVSVYLFFFADRVQGIFVGLWVPSILAAGSLVLAESRHE